MFQPERDIVKALYLSKQHSRCAFAVLISFKCCKQLSQHYGNTAYNFQTRQMILLLSMKMYE